jgi:DNA (cytosine-5)-methyltransferase 1
MLSGDERMVAAPIRYLDVCSGYSAITLATEGLGFECAGYAEIDAFPAAVLGARYGASRPRYMPDPDAPGLPAKDRRERERIIKSVASLSDAHFGNRVVNFGDFTQIRDDDVGPIDLLAGGTPCQAFSVAGKRLGLDDPRGNLTLEFLALARRLRPRWLLWENVAGILSHDKGRTLGTFLGLLGQLGYGWAYRVLDVQYIRVDGFARAIPQRRRRVFVVGHLGDPARAAAVLFERESLRGDPAPRRETGEGVAAATAPSLVSSGRGVERTGETRGQDPVVAVAFGGGNRGGAIDAAACLTAKGQRVDFEVETFIASPIASTLTRGAESKGKGGAAGRRQEDDSNVVAHALRADGFDASEDGTGRGTPLAPVCQPYVLMERGRDGGSVLEYRNDGTANALLTPNGGRGGMGVGAIAHPPAVAMCIHADAIGRSGSALTPSVDGAGRVRLRDAGMGVAEGAAFGITTGQPHAVIQGWAVRRLTPTEAARLMGVPDDFLRITYRGKPAADGPIYKALGNSQGTNVMRWIAHGIRMVDDIARTTHHPRRGRCDDRAAAGGAGEDRIL